MPVVSVRTLLALSLLLSTPVLAADLEVAGGPALRAALTPRGDRPLLVHVWASWCKPCVAEWPYLADLLRESSDRPLDVVILSIDEATNTAAASAVLGRLGELPGRILLAPPAVAMAALATFDREWQGAIPATLIADPTGRIIHAERGGTDFGALETAIESAAPRPAAPERP